MTAEAIIRERVTRGAKFLDEACPGWVGRISLERLSLESPHRCIFGQLEGEYTAGIRKYGIVDQAEALGFTLTDERNRVANWDLLNEVWREEVEGRLVGRSN